MPPRSSTIARNAIGGVIGTPVDDVELDRQQIRDEDELEEAREEFDKPFIVDGFETPRSCVETVEEFFRRGRQRMYPFLRQWCINTLMYRGLQYLMFDTDQPYQVENLNGPATSARDEEFEASVQYSANLIQGHMDAWIAKMIAHDPRVSTFPVRDDEHARELADITRMLINWKREEQDFSGEYLRAITLVGLHGNVFLKACWNEMGGALVNPVAKMKPGDREIRGVKPAGMGDLEFEGNIEQKAIPAFHMTYPEEYIASIGEARYIIETRIETMQSLKEQHADNPNIHHVNPGLDEEGYRLWFAERISDFGQFSQGGGSDGMETGGAVLDSMQPVLVHHLYGKATRHRQKGIYLKVAGGQLLYPNVPDDATELSDEHANPYWHGQLPYAHLKQVDDGITLWGTSKCEQSIEPQMEYNAGASQIIESRNMTANPIRLVEKNAVTNKGKIIGCPGEWWDVKRGMIDKIKNLEAPNLPPYVSQQLAECRSTLEHIFADHSPQQGVSTPGDSGFKVRSLQMANEERHVPYARSAASALKRHFLQVVQLLAQYGNDSQQGYITGIEHERAFFTWTKHQLVPRFDTEMGAAYSDEDTYRRSMVYSLGRQFDLSVDVVAGRSHQTAQDDVNLMLQSGMLQPALNERHFKIVMDMLGYRHEQPELLVEKHEQASQAQRENDLFMAGETMILPPGNYEDHDVHLRRHRKLTNSETFRALPDQVRALFLGHIQLHEEAIIREPMRLKLLSMKVASEMEQVMGLPPGTVGAMMAADQQQTGDQQGGQKPRSGSDAGSGRGRRSAEEAGGQRAA